MPKNVTSIAVELDGFMKEKSVSVLTMPWAQLYKIADRERIKEAFQTDLSNALKGHNLFVAYTDNAVVVHRGSNFAPQEWKK